MLKETDIMTINEAESPLDGVEKGGKKTNVLKLNLKKKWFDKIKRGTKTEDYRGLKHYWFARLCTYQIDGDKITYTVKPFEIAELTNGYRTDADKMVFKITEITIGPGKKAWGASKNVDYFTIKLGERIS